MARILLSEAVRGRDPHPVAPDTPLREAARLLCEDWTHGALPVVEAGRLTGIVSKRDLICKGVVAGLDLDAATVAQVMTPGPATLPGDATMADAYRLMQAKGYRHIPVMEGERLAGMVAYRDIPTAVKNLADRFDEFSHSNPEVFEH